MTLLNPAGLLLLLLIPPIILLHRSTAIRRQVDVAELGLWRLDRDQRDSSTRTLRKIRWSLSLLLQLLAVLLAALALAQPAIQGSERGWSRVILLVDSSASMGATDVTPNRFAVTVRKAKDFVAEMSSGQEAAIIDLSGRPSIKAAFTADRKELQNTLDSIEITDGPANVGQALRLAGDLSAEKPSAVHIFTDAAYLPPSIAGIEAPVLWHVTGRTTDNVGIARLELRQKGLGDPRYQAMVTLVNSSDEPKALTLRVTVDGDAIFEEAANLEGKHRRSYIVPMKYSGGGVVRADIDIEDDLAADNVAYAVFPPSKGRKVLLVSPGNYFLENALRANGSLEVVSLRPELFDAQSADADIVILDGVTLPSLPPGNYVLIRSTVDDLPLKTDGSVEFPKVVDWDETHIVGRHLDLSDLMIGNATKVQADAACDTIVEAQVTPLVLACLDQGRRFVFVGFDLLRSEMPLTVSFPILLANALEWLVPSSPDSTPQYYRSGEGVTVFLDDKRDKVQVERPDNRREVVSLENGLLSYQDTHRAGVYTIESEGRSHSFAVSLLDGQETDLTPGRGRVETRRALHPPVYNYEIELWRYMALLALVALLADLLFALRNRSAYPPISALALRCIALLALASALARPAIDVASKDTNISFLVDLSNSVSLQERKDALAAVADAISQTSQGETTNAMAFAAIVRPLPELNMDAVSPGDVFSDEEREGTDIADPMLLALGVLPKTGDRRIVILSDGNENRSSAANAALQARRDNVPIYPIPLVPRRTPEVAVTKFVAPDEAKEGEAYGLRAIIWSSRPQMAELQLFRDGEPIAKEDVRLNPGKNAFLYRDTSERKGGVDYVMKVGAAEDADEKNNTAAATVLVGGKSRVILVENDLSRSRNVLAALSQQRFSVDVIRGESVSEAALSDYDAVILGSVPASHLEERGLAALEGYVKDEGGGLIVLGGTRSFGLGGYGGTTLEDLLPLYLAPPARLELPSQAIVFVLDRSGSMSTEQGQHSRLELAKQGAQQSILMLNKDALVGVLAFDTETDWVVPLGRVDDKEAMISRIGTIEAGGGGTELLTALQEAYLAVKQADTMVKHIVILSDGEAPENDFRKLLEQSERDKISVSSIAISSEAGRDLLKKVADWGAGRYHFTENLDELPRIVTGETQLAANDGVIEESFRPNAKLRWSEVLEEIDWSRVPALHGYVATTIKPQAQSLLVSHRGDPVLAVWQKGLGRVVAYTSDVSGNWGREWLTWGEFGQFFGQLVRWAAKPPADEVLAQLSFNDGEGRLVADVTDDDGDPINFLEGQAAIVRPDGSRTAATLEQVAPGRYGADFPAESEGRYLVAISFKSEESDRLPTKLVTGTVMGSQEHSTPTANLKLLRQIADTSRGRLLTSPREVFAIPASGLRSLSLWPWLVVAALALLLGELILRLLHGRNYQPGNLRPRTQSRSSRSSVNL